MATGKCKWCGRHFECRQDFWGRTPDFCSTRCELEYNDAHGGEAAKGGGFWRGLKKFIKWVLIIALVIIFLSIFAE